VALKLFQKFDEDSTAAFHIEARYGRTFMGWPNVAQCFRNPASRDECLTHEYPDAFGLALELYDGDLRTFASPRRPPLTLDGLFKIFEGLATGLRMMHQHGFVHLDLKPANVFYRRVDGGFIMPYLADFGLVEQAVDSVDPAFQAEWNRLRIRNQDDNSVQICSGSKITGGYRGPEMAFSTYDPKRYVRVVAPDPSKDEQDIDYGNAPRYPLHSADMFSLGETFFQLYAASPYPLFHFINRRVDYADVNLYYVDGLEAPSAFEEAAKITKAKYGQLELSISLYSGELDDRVHAHITGVIAHMIKWDVSGRPSTSSLLENFLADMLDMLHPRRDAVLSSMEDLSLYTEVN